MPACPHCSHDNPPGAKFCSDCGAPQARACPSCGHANAAGAKFCNECGARLETATATPASPPALSSNQATDQPSFPLPPEVPSLGGERRRVTVLFADLSGSTALGERFDAEVVYDVMNGCFAGLAQIIEAHGGHVLKYIGDCIMALFGAPVAHGDDPQRAVRAALEMQIWLGDFSRDLEAQRGVPFRMRIGLNYGHVVAGGVGGDARKSYDVLGDAVNVAQRLESIAEPGCVYLSDALRRLTARDFEFAAIGRVPVKGRAEEVEVFRAIGPRSAPAAALKNGRLIGRDHEIAALHGAVDSLEKGGVFTLCGEAGIGKTRLLDMAMQRAAERAAPVHFVSCVEREAVQPFALVRRLLGEFSLAKLAPPDAPWLPALQLLFAPTIHGHLDEEARKNMILHGVCEIFARLCREAPRLLVVDDAQWLDELSAQVLDALAQHVAPQGLFILIAHWPGFAHQWPQAQFRKLDGLSHEHCVALIEDLIGAAALPTNVQSEIVTRSGGNPFYLREVLYQLIEAGHLRSEGGVWRADDSIGAFAVPDTVYSALVARLDRLDAATRDALQSGAVFGLEFPARFLQTPQNHDASPALRRLEALDFLVEAAPPPDWALRFRHAALREVAYDALLLSERKTRHARIAAWLEETYSGRENEIAAQLAHHHQRAGDAVSATRYWITAGERARALFANADALRFFAQAIEVDPDALLALRGAGLVQLRLGNFADAARLWQRVLECACGKNYHSEALRHLAQCRHETGDDESALAALREAFRLLRGANSNFIERQRSLILHDWGKLLYRQGRYAAAARLGRTAYKLAWDAFDSGDERGSAANLLGLIAQARGRTAEAIEHYEECRHIAQSSGDISGAAIAANNLGTVHFHAGRLAQAQSSWEEARDVWEKIGDAVQLAWAFHNLGNLHLARGDYASALSHFERAGVRFRQAGQKFGEAAALAVCGEVQIEQEQYSAAVASLRAAQTLARELEILDLVAYSGTMLSVALLQNGDEETAQTTAREALELSQRLKNPTFQGIAWRTLGQIFLRRGDFAVAHQALSAAVEIFSQHELLQEKGRALLSLSQWHATQNQSEAATRCRDDAIEIFQQIGAGADIQKAT